MSRPVAGASGRLPLTGQAHAAWSARLHSGDWAVDATAGNGHDTVWLARCAGPAGRVFAVDIQEAALAATAARLRKEGLAGRVTLIQGDHARLPELLPEAARGRIALVCFNLGYLPGGDHRLTTRPDSTVAALEASLRLLVPEGALSVIAYRGHPGAAEEAAAVAAFLGRLPPPWRCSEKVSTGSGRRPGPVWWLVERARAAAVTGT